VAQQPLVIAYHLIWTAYGYWLPNDPRGSGSHTIRNDVLAELGELHYGRKRIQPAGREIREFYEQAVPLLMHPRLIFDEQCRDRIAVGFGEVIAAECYTCYACVIMPDHVHILVRKHKHQAEEMIDNLKNQTLGDLRDSGWCSQAHPVWSGGGGWKIFLDHPDEIRRTIVYIEKNPQPLGLPDQQWPFVTAYDGWPLHPGHSPNSPYAKALKAVGRYP
jgi:REP element-mobilizing transposase RayT